MFLKRCVFSVSSSNIFLICNNKGMQLMRKLVAVEHSLLQEYCPYLSLWQSKFSLKLSGIAELKFCKDRRFSLTTVQRKTLTNLQKNACGESTIATLLLIEDSIKNFVRKFYTNSFRRTTLAKLMMYFRYFVPSKNIRWGQDGCFRYRIFEKILLFWSGSLVEYFPEPAIHSVVF